MSSRCQLSIWQKLISLKGFLIWFCTVVDRFIFVQLLYSTLLLVCLSEHSGIRKWMHLFWLLKLFWASRRDDYILVYCIMKSRFKNIKHAFFTVPGSVIWVTVQTNSLLLAPCLCTLNDSYGHLQNPVQELLTWFDFRFKPKEGGTVTFPTGKFFCTLHCIVKIFLIYNSWLTARKSFRFPQRADDDSF